MNKILAKIISLPILNKEKRKQFRNKLTNNKSQNSNKKIENNYNQIDSLRKKKYEKIKNIIIEEKFNNNGKCDFLSDDLKIKYNVEDTENISQHNYCQDALDLIKKYKDGLILDCGSGLRPIYYENVVNYEIVDYNTTDVLGVGEKLPFKDNSFDAIFSFAVFEHLKDPFKAADEISRVLKPGGILLFDACFSQPFHGYPNHYFNMTPSGARILFNDKLKIERQFVSDNFHPIYSLKWYLSIWSESLSKETQKEFMNLKIKDILNFDEKDLSSNGKFNAGWLDNIPEDKKIEICAGTRVIAIKK